MTADPFAVLARLATEAPLSGAALAPQLGATPGTVGVRIAEASTLGGLVRRGLVHAARDRAGRDLYSLTARGRAVARALDETP